MPLESKIAKIAVVIPAWNSAAYLRRAIDSAVTQDWPATEIIVVDDGSTDDTAAIAQRCGPRVRLIRQARAGADAARNLAIRSTDAEFIAFLDSDDAYLPERLVACVAPMLADPAVGMTYCHARPMNRPKDGPVLGKEFERHRVFARRLWPSALQCTPGTTCRRATLIATGMFDRPLSGWADLDLWIRMAELSKVIEVPRVLTLVDARPASLSRSFDEAASREAYFQVIADAIARRPDLYAAHRAEIEADAWMFWGIRAYAQGKHVQAREFFNYSIRLSPTSRARSFRLRTFAPPALMRTIRRLRKRGKG